MKFTFPKTLFFSFLSISVLMILLAKANFAHATSYSIGEFECIGRWCPSGSITEDGGFWTSAIESVVSTIIGFLTVVAGLYFFAFFIIGGLNWASAGGDEKKVADARHRMTNAAIGLIIVVASFSIIYIVSSVLGLDIINLANTITKIGQ